VPRPEQQEPQEPQVAPALQVEPEELQLPAAMTAEPAATRGRQTSGKDN